MATYKHIASLIIKYRNNELTDKEKQELDEWCALSEKNRQLFERLNDNNYLDLKRKRFESIDIEGQWEKISSRLPPLKQPGRLQVLAKNWAAAAITVGMVLGAGIIWYRANRSAPESNGRPTVQQQPVATVSKRTELKLANGNVVYLDGRNDGQVAKQDRATIYKKGEWINYEFASGGQDQAEAYNTVTTPPGKNCKIILPDGSKVWMNAASSITYPTSFTGKERKVTVTGEVYFEVVHQLTAVTQNSNTDAAIPFIVDVASVDNHPRSRVEVLGTHFNINAYGDEPLVATTLLEGKVKVAVVNSSNTSILKPGQQAQITDNGKLSVVKHVDAEEVVGWTVDQFKYNDQDIRVVLRDLARWYDMEVVYKTKVEGYITFTSSKRSTINEILKVIEKTGDNMHFSIEGKQIIVKGSAG